MSVILKDQNGQIRLICKGADSIIQARLEKTKPTQDLFKTTDKFLADYAKNGLRTLLIAERILEPSYYEAWAEKYYQASIAMQDRDDKIDAVAEEIEVQLKIVGSTAIEDLLQD